MYNNSSRPTRGPRSSFGSQNSSSPQSSSSNSGYNSSSSRSNHSSGKDSHQTSRPESNNNSNYTSSNSSNVDSYGGASVDLSSKSSTRPSSGPSRGGYSSQSSDRNYDRSDRGRDRNSSSRDNRDGGRENRDSYGSSWGNSSGGRSGGGRYGSSGGRSDSGRGGRGGNSRAKLQREISRTLDYSRFIKKVTKPVATEEVAITGRTFDQFGLDSRVLAALKTKGYANSTPIQNQTIELALSGRDVVGLANTGTGKTAAFLLPLIHKTLNDPKLQTIILTPTRELAQQIRQELIEFTNDMPIYSMCIVGGTSIDSQMRKLGKFQNFIIGTPGRIKDLLNRNKLRLDRTQHIVLDEMDRMLDMGFIDDLNFILGKVPAPRQSLFFSATMSREVETLMQQFLVDPVTVSVRTGNTSDSVNQDIVKVARGQQKIEVLHELLIKEEFTRVLIFGQTKMGVERLANDLYDRGFKAQAIHGDKTQGKRQQALRMFKGGEINILVATDVAARGLDISNVTHVINYELPQNYEDYIHRIGRTGRADQIGNALTFVE